MTVDPVVQLKIDGTWTNVVRYDTQTKIAGDGGVSISRGQGGLKSETPAGTCNWTWHDPNGIYNNENPRSPYYGLLSRNTPVRVYVPRAAPSLLIVDVDDGARAQTADSAALDITGDIELRIDIEPRRFRRWGSGNTSRRMLLCSKYGASGNRSWHLRMKEDGFLEWITSSTGSNTLTATSTAKLPTTGRIAIKVTEDVDNGAGALEVKFWTADTIAGTYTQLGSTITGAGTTTIFASTANIELGTMNGGGLDGSFSSLVENFYGRIHGFRLYNGIAGSLVANADFTAQTVGTTSFSDGLGNTWTTAGVAEITNADYRFHGELSAVTQKVNESHSGTGVDVDMSAEAGGIIRRLTANEAPPVSPIYAAFSTYGANGWWTGEDSTDADTDVASSAVEGVQPASITDITFSGFDSAFAGSAGVMTCGSTGPTFVGTCRSVASTGEAHFVGYFQFPSIPLSNQTLFSVYSNDGTIRRWDFVVGATQYVLNGYNSAGTLTVTKTTLHGTGTEPTNVIGYHLSIKVNGANVDTIRSEWFAVGTDLYLSQNATGTLTYAGSTGIFNKVVVQAVAGLSGVKLAHLMTTTQVGFNNTFYDGSSLEFAQFSRAFAGETADARFERVCALLGVQPVIIGERGDTEQMGAQPIDTGMNVLYECSSVDGGVITEAVDQLALEFRTRMSLYNQYGLELTYAQLSDGLEGTPDDTDIANDIILTRSNGGTARATLAYGPMSTQASPNGIGLVADGPTVNNYVDSRLPALVQFALLKRSWPTSRYPSVRIEMHRSPFTGSAALYLLAEKTEITDLVTITGLPNFMAPDALYLLVKGVNEQLNKFTWDITWTMVPYGPYQTSELNTDGNYTFKAATHTEAGVVQTQLNADITSSATSIAVKTLSGALVDTAVTNLSIKIGGERMTVTAVSGTSSPQTLTVTRGVDGWSGAHLADDYVYVVPTLKARL